jgi:hypothetical protein
MAARSTQRAPGLPFRVRESSLVWRKSNTMRRTIAVLGALSLVSTPLFAQSEVSVQEAVSSVTPADVAARIGVIAADSMRGRDTPSPELDKTAQYIAGEFQRFGLQPGGDDGTFLQRYVIRQVALNVDASTVRIAGGATWHAGNEFLSLGGTGGQVSGTPYLVSGGAGEAPSLDDVPDRSILILAVPMQSLRTMFAGLQSKAPAAVFLVRERPEAQWERAAAAQRQPTAQVGDGSERDGRMFLELKPATLAALLEQQGLDPTLASGAADAPMAITLLDGVTMEIDLAYETVAETTAPNVVGVLEGSDPQLKDEYLVYSAHMDHVGVGRAVNGDSIYNGADDDASGTIAVVELAEAFAKLHPRPKRSIIFLTVSGEETGLWGSAHFAANPTVPMEQIVANLNADMVGRNWPDTIVVIGKEHSDLGETLNRVNAAHPELGMTAIDDIWPEENFYDRSDHINFARRGVPILFFFNGTHPDYHRPSDEVEKIDAEKEARIVQLMLYLGIDIANAAQRPKWNPESYEKIVSE